MIPGSIARRYARALFELAKEDDAVDAYGKGLTAFFQAVHDAPGALMSLGEQWFGQGERIAAVEEIGARLKTPEMVIRFLSQLVRKGRIHSLPDIVREYQVLHDDALGIVRVVVTTPEAPKPAGLQKVERLLSHRLKKKVIASGRTDPEIIGGIVLEVDHTVYDGSIRTELTRMREQMMRKEI